MSSDLLFQFVGGAVAFMAAGTWVLRNWITGKQSADKAEHGGGWAYEGTPSVAFQVGRDIVEELRNIARVLEELNDRYNQSPPRRRRRRTKRT